MKVTRRDLFVWGAGAAAGLVFTPVPWKLLDDVSIWTQNWPWIPQPAHGPVETKQSFCALCPQGCALKVKMEGGWPVGLSGVSTNPLTRGALCPLAFGAHQLNWHAQRVRAVRHNGVPSSWSEARAALAKACGEGPLVIIDARPGSAASFVLSRFAEKHKGEYRVAMSAESGALMPYESWSGVAANSLGYDLENARTIVSFGAPLLDSWGIPGRFTRLWSERAAGAGDPDLRLVHIEDSLSRTASRAWRWINIRRGSESALAVGVARVLIEERLVAARGPVPSLSVADAAAQAGVSESAVRELARTIVEHTPVLAVANNNNPEIAALNVVLGAVGARGGIIRKSRRAHKLVTAEHTIPGARAILIDSSVPWNFNLRTDAEIFRFAAWDRGLEKSHWLLPAPGFLEELTDVPAPPTSASEIYAIAPQLCKPIVEVQSAAQFLSGIDSGLPSVEETIHGRCVDLFRQRSGNVHGREISAVARFDSVQKLEAEMRNGAIWVGDPPPPGGLRCELKDWPTAMVAEPSWNWDSSWSPPALPSLATKLYRESSLREAPAGRTA